MALCALLLGLPAAGCGPILDWYDEKNQVCGGVHPDGMWKRNFWGFSYFERNPEYYRRLSETYVPYTTVEPQPGDELSSRSP
jgi:hypothetical protein